MIKFLKDFFRMPSSNGERRLVKNIFNGKMVWTRGLEPKFVENPEIKKILQKEFIQNSNYEPISKARFVVEFPGIDSFMISSYNFLGEESKTKREWSEFNINLFIASNVDLVFYSKKSEKIGSINILVLDPIGNVIRTIELPNCHIEKVDLYEQFDYSKYSREDYQIMKIKVSHSQRKLS